MKTEEQQQMHGSSGPILPVGGSALLAPESTVDEHHKNETVAVTAVAHSASVPSNDKSAGKDVTRLPKDSSPAAKEAMKLEKCEAVGAANEESADTAALLGQSQSSAAAAVDSVALQIRGLTLDPSKFEQLRRWQDQLRPLDTMNNLSQILGEPLSILQELSLCGAPLGMPRIMGPSHLLPPPLRHTHSSPNHGTRNNLLHSEDAAVPPLPPIALDPFQRSSSTPSSLRQPSFGTTDGSAFTLPPRRIIPSVSETGTSAFGPVQYYSMALEDMERTSIEVDLSAMESGPPKVRKKKKGAASRAARFLSDVRVLRRRRRRQGGRENPNFLKFRRDSQSTLDTTVTVITESDFDSAADPDHNEADQLGNDRADLLAIETMVEPISEMLQANLQQLRSVLALETIAASPSPSRMEPLETSSTAPHSSDSSSSPQTTATGSSSGQATQTTGRQSQLSKISETDREVRETNKEAKRRHQEVDVATVPASEPDSLCNYSSSSGSTNPSRYFSLASGNSLRDGANLVTDRLFNGSPRQVALSLSLTTSSSTAGTTTEPSVSETQSSFNSSTDKPPSVVAYVDQDNSSDVTSVRDTTEAQREMSSERDVSPAVGLLGDSDISFEVPTDPSTRSSRLYRIRARQRIPRLTKGTPRQHSTTPPAQSPLTQSKPSPPRNIVDQCNSDTPKPNVMRSWLGNNPTLSAHQTLLSDSIQTLAPTVPVDSSGNVEEALKGESLADTCHDNSIEVEIVDKPTSDCLATIVTPGKQ